MFSWFPRTFIFDRGGGGDKIITKLKKIPKQFSSVIVIAHNSESHGQIIFAC